MASNVKQLALSVLSILAILGSAAWIYFGQFKSAKHNVPLHQRVGEVMAEQTARLVARKGRVVLITIPTGGEPELKTQLDSFHRTLKKLGDYELKEYELDTKDQPKYGVGTGLSGRRYVRMVKKNEKADVFVSFVGAPGLKDEELAELGKPPKFVAETRTPDHLPKLFDKQIISVAVVSRFVFPAPGPQAPKTSQEWFDKRYQIIAADSVSTIPKPE